MLIVSACLAGINCRYDGKNNLNKDILDMVKQGKAMLVCPEQLAGLTTPRAPAEIVVDDEENRKVVNKLGEDVTKEFVTGAVETLKIAKNIDAKVAILKSRSPSCGYGSIYDGSFTSKIKKGNGLTADLLSKNGIKIFTEEDLPLDF